jgi:ADP-heptose:LPS heptosyltransferase
MPKILVLRFSSIGDIVLTTPVMRTLKRQLDDSEVHFCTKENMKTVIAENPYIDKIHTLKNSLWQLIGELRAEKYDYIIDLHHNLRTFIIKTALGAYSPFHAIKAYSFDKLNFEKWLLVHFKINRMPTDLHIVDRYMQTVKPLGVKMDKFGLDYFIPYKDIVEKEWLPETHQNGYVAYVLGAQHNTKKLPLLKMIELCEKINRPIILLGDKNDKILADQIEQYFTDKYAKMKDHEKVLSLGTQRTVIYNACGKFNLNQSASLLKESTVVFAHDTGLMHIAAAFKKTIYSIWGNTTPILGMYPYRTKYHVLENNKIKCRPCSKIGFKECPKKHFKCMNDIQFHFYIE